MKCILCLKIPEKPIDIFGEQGLSLDIKCIISKHFWLEPNQDDISTLICSLCWTAVDAFHKFYEQIREVHCSFQEIKPAVAEGDLEVRGSTSKVNRLGDKNLYLHEDIKVETSESTNLSNELQCNINPLEMSVRIDEKDIEIKSDSESEMSLSQLSKQLQKKDKSLRQSNITEVIQLQKGSRSSKNNIGEPKKKLLKDRTPKKSSTETKLSAESKDKNEEKLHIHEGKWLAKCYAEETYSRPISSEELDKYIKQNIELSCGVCHIPLDEFASLHPHFVKCHDKIKPYVTCCGKKLRFRAHIIDHSLVHKIPDYFKCVECPKVWPSRRNLKVHLLIHNKNFIYQCEKCHKSFGTKAALEFHHEVHFVDRPFKCEECNKFYATDYRLKQHIYHVHHYKKICEQCGQVFREKETFVQHQLKHTNQPKPIFECKICGARLSSRKILQKHNKFQHLENSIEQNCNLCGIKVKNLQALKRHMNFVHKYKREHKCTMCDKAFKRALILKVSKSF